MNRKFRVVVVQRRALNSNLHHLERAYCV